MLLSPVIAFANGNDDGVYIGISSGYGIANTLNPMDNWASFDSGLAGRVDFGSRIDTSFGFEIGYSQASILNNNPTGYNLDVLLNYYQETNSRWNLIYGVGPFYNSAVAGVGVLFNFGTEYYFSKSVAWTMGEYLYINPNVQGNYNSISPYLLNNIVTTGFKFNF